MRLPEITKINMKSFSIFFVVLELNCTRITRTRNYNSINTTPDSSVESVFYTRL